METKTYILEGNEIFWKEVKTKYGRKPKLKF